MTVLQRFRVLTFQFTVGVSAVVAAILYFISVPAAKGFLAAGIVGGLAFWLNARQAEKLAFLPRAKVNSAIYRATLIRMGLYAITFYWAFTLDRETMHGLLGALAGMFVIQIVLIFMGLTGFDLGKTTRANGTDR